MEEMDNKDALYGISDEDLLLQEVIQDDPELFFLHHYLHEVYRKG